MLKFYRLISFILLLISGTASADCVILLHGLARTKTSMAILEKALDDQGYSVVNTGYPSRQYNIETLALSAIDQGLSLCPEGQEINFVTHSLGGILVRYYLEQKTIEKLNRVVMLAPPNQGSEVVDKLKNIPGFFAINGEAGMQLGTEKTSIPKQLGKVDFELGIITGDRSINWFLSLLIPGKDDGKVSIESSKVEGMKEHIVMPVSHPFIMNKQAVIEQVIHFLEKGHFLHEEKAALTQ